MHANRLILMGIVFISISGALITIGLAAETGNHDMYAGLLEKYVENGKVDYEGLKSEEAILDTYLNRLAQIDPKMLSGEEQFAFYANAYNAWTIKLILSGYPGVKSIKDLGTLLKSPWKKKIARIDGGLITLDQIEHDILRPRFKDPRVHFAINCAAKSCPPLASEPFIGEKLNRQLDRLTRSFVNDSSSNYLKGKILHVSSIFKWFKSDFEDGIVKFFLKYAEGDLKAALDPNEDKVKIKYLDYDWSLNGE